MFGWTKIRKEEAKRIIKILNNTKDGRLSSRKGKWGKKYAPGPDEFIQAKVKCGWIENYGINVTLITQDILSLNEKKRDTAQRQMITYTYEGFIKI